MKWAFTLLILFLSQAVCAQVRLSLEECIDYALEHSLQLKQQQIAIETEENALLQSKLSLLPSVGLSSDYSLDKSDSQFGGSLTANLTLFDGLKGLRNVESAILSLEKARNDALVREMELKIAVTRAYLSCLLAKRAVELAEENYRAILAQRDLIAKKVEAGDRPAGAIIEINSEVAAGYSLTVNRRGEADIARLDLMQLLEWDSPAFFETEDPEMEIVQPDFGSYSRLVEEVYGLPQIASGEYDLDIALKQLQVARSGLLPTISVSAGFSTGYCPVISDSFGLQLKNNYLYSTVFTFSIPIFSHYSAMTQVKNAELAVRHSELQLEKSLLEAEREVRLAINQASVFYHNLLAAQEKMAAANEALRICTRKLENGLATVTDYILSMEKFYEAQSEYSTAYYQYLFQIKILDCYLEYHETKRN
ncbi:MAG: TolC family protein [Bacteroidales bacterium]|nr:TolC family protein [Bacteroidales bacterium]